MTLKANVSIYHLRITFWSLALTKSSFPGGSLGLGVWI